MYNSEDKDTAFQLWDLLWMLSNLIMKLRERELKKYDFTAIRASVLHIVTLLEGKAIPAEIARQLLREPHSISHLISSMETEGLVNKRKDLNKKNFVRVVLTENGRQAYETTKKRHSIHKVMSTLSKQEQEQILCLLQRVWDKAIEEFRLSNSHRGFTL